MGQEFFVKSNTLEDKVRQILPSQGGLGQGFDLSASTQIVPIVDLTESAEGSTLREDLQTSLSLDTVTAYSVTNTTTTLISNTGYFRVFGTFDALSQSATLGKGTFTLTDGVTSKIIVTYNVGANATVTRSIENYNFIVFLDAGQSLTCTSNGTSVRLQGVTRQIANIDGELVNP